MYEKLVRWVDEEKVPSLDPESPPDTEGNINPDDLELNDFSWRRARDSWEDD